jgi:hypothetical protein
MATPIQPTAPTVSSADEYDKIRKQLKYLLDDQGDYNNLLKDSIRSINRLSDAYLKIESRLESLNKGSINIKDTQRELTKLKEKEYIEQTKYNQALNNADGPTKQALAIAKQKTNELVEMSNLLGEQVDYGDALLKYLAENNDLQAVQLAALEQSLALSKLQTENGEKYVEVEKNVNRQLGISGNLMKNFAEKLGVGNEVYEAMTKNARKLVDANGKVVGSTSVIVAGLKAGAKEFGIWWQSTSNIGKALAVAGIAAAGLSKATQSIKKGFTSITSSGGPIAGLTSGISSMLSNIPLIGGFLSGVVDMFSNLLDFAVGAKSEIQKMGREVGLTADQSVKLNNQFSDFVTYSGKAYLNSKGLFETFLSISKVLGLNNKISNDNLQTQYELNKFLGVSAETGAELEKSSRLTGKSSKEIAQNVFSQTKSLERATGVSFNFQEILKESASLGGVLGLQFSKYPDKITNAVLATKAMGLELKQLEGMADGFLDFESSISKEFEAQLLTGKDINLMKARELFLNNDLAAAGAELTKQIGSSGEFLNYNRIQQESFASSVGMSRDQMADMLKQQEYLSKFGAKDTKDLQERVRLYRSQGKAQQAIALLGDKMAYNKIVESTATEDLAGFIDKIKQSFADMVANGKLADFVKGAMDFLSRPDSIMNIVNKIKNVFGSIVTAIGAVMGGIMHALNYLPGINIDESLIDMVQSAGAEIKAANLGDLGNFGAAKSVSTQTATAAANTGTPMGMMTANRNTQSTVNNYKTSVSIDIMRGTYVVKTIDADSGVLQDTQHGMIGKTTVK